MSFDEENPYTIRYINGSLKVVIPGTNNNVEITLMEGNKHESNREEEPEDSE